MGKEAMEPGLVTRHAERQPREDRTGMLALNGIIERAEDSTVGLKESDPKWWVKGL